MLPAENDTEEQRIVKRFIETMNIEQVLVQEKSSGTVGSGRLKGNRGYRHFFIVDGVVFVE